ncbi:MAG: hypothetical protein PHW02_08820, partial [bacterium]|nr:hypothetical protein [bacterium]
PNSLMAQNIVFSHSVCEPIYSSKIDISDSFSCWLWYDLEDSFDMALVEISEDGMEYLAFDTIGGIFNESSFGWKYYSKSLSDYAGKEVFIRTRVMFDDGTFGPGFYIDDIYPVTRFVKDSLYATVSADTFLQLNQSDSAFYFSVQPVHSERGPLIKSMRMPFYYQTGLLNQDFLNDNSKDGVNEISLFQSMTNKILFVKIISEKTNPLECQIFNSAGQRVDRILLKPNCINEVNLSSLKSGEYFLDFGNRTNKARKIIVIK